MCISLTFPPVVLISSLLKFHLPGLFPWNLAYVAQCPVIIFQSPSLSSFLRPYQFFHYYHPLSEILCLRFPVSIPEFASLGFNLFSQFHLIDPDISCLALPYMSLMTCCQSLLPECPTSAIVQDPQLRGVLHLKLNALQVLFWFLIILSLHLYFLSVVWWHLGHVPVSTMGPILGCLGVGLSLFTYVSSGRVRLVHYLRSLSD